mmetsp:Transcript_38014/g.42031  ORF Transcript_38014/g.42031 Transcript_38014/m.42031 type:complete len:265 (-) Transcript_38014:211-1005(-)
MIMSCIKNAYSSGVTSKTESSTRLDAAIISGSFFNSADAQAIALRFVFNAKRRISLSALKGSAINCIAFPQLAIAANTTSLSHLQQSSQFRSSQPLPTLNLSINFRLSFDHVCSSIFFCFSVTCDIPPLYFWIVVIIITITVVTIVILRDVVVSAIVVVSITFIIIIIIIVANDNNWGYTLFTTVASINSFTNFVIIVVVVYNNYRSVTSIFFTTVTNSEYSFFIIVLVTTIIVVVITINDDKRSSTFLATIIINTFIFIIKDN